MDGIIFDTEKLWKDASEKANVEFNIFVNEKTRVQFCGQKESKIKILLKQMFPYVDADKCREWQFDYVKEQAKHKRNLVKKGFLELVTFLKSKNIKLGIATGSSLDLVKHYFSIININVNDYFDGVATIDDVTVGKPSPMVYQVACKKLKVKPSECYAIEDSPNGINSAKSAGVTPLMVVDLVKPNASLTSSCESVFKNLVEVKKYLKAKLQEE